MKSTSEVVCSSVLETVSNYLYVNEIMQVVYYRC